MNNSQLVFPVKGVGRGVCKLVSILLFFFITTFSAGAQGSDAKCQEYNNLALKQLNEAQYDECLKTLDLALREKENAVSYYYLCHVNATMKDWESAVRYGEKAIKMDPNITAVYYDLFVSYMNANKWKEAKGIIDNVKKANPDKNLTEDIGNIDSAIENQNKSGMFVVLFLLILAGVFALPILKPAPDNSNPLPETDRFRFSEVLLSTISVSAVLWMAFYACSHYIWSLNPHIPAYEFTTMIRIYVYEHDGAESFVLYLMMFVNLVLSLLISMQLLKVRKNRSTYMGVYTVMLLAAAFYFYNVGFFPPVTPATSGKALVYGFLFSGLSVGLYFAYKKLPILAYSLIGIFSAYAALISFSPASLTDLQFVLDPALRLFHGFKVSEIYFQYDLFLSYLALFWMKMSWGLDSFTYLANIAFFLFFLGCLYFSESMFKTKGLSVVFLVALIVIRIYIQGYDFPSIFQVSPLRIDLWLLLLLLAHKFGVRHWLTASCVGLLVLFHRNLGLIYLGAYVELLIALFVLDLMPLFTEKTFSFKTLMEMVGKHLKLNMLNLIIVFASVGLCFVLFKELFSSSALTYRKIGVGMLPISRQSFYWYVPVILATIVSYLFFYRSKLGEKYVQVGLFLVLLVIGNSMYFFGRSHENNILNISGILVLLVFLLFDMLIYFSPMEEKSAGTAPSPSQAAKNKKVATPAVAEASGKSFLNRSVVYLVLPVVFIFLTGFYYSDRISDKLNTQYGNLLESKYYYPLQEVPNDSAAVKEITHNSKKVYFFDLYQDFYFYYYGGYIPQGLFNPCSAWVYKKDVDSLMQDLLDKDYYIVFDVRYYNVVGEYVSTLKYNQMYQKRNNVALKKENVKLELPDGPNKVYHIGIKDPLGNDGIDYRGLSLGEEFSLEVIIRPGAQQVANAMIINNLNNLNGLTGITLQGNNNFPNKFVFGFSNGTPQIPNSVFELEPEKWHYLAINVNKTQLTIYDNGHLLATAPSGGGSYKHNDKPITIGNNSERKSPFNGIIKEVKFSNGNLQEAEIANTAQKLMAGMGTK